MLGKGSQAKLLVSVSVVIRRADTALKTHLPYTCNTPVVLCIHNLKKYLIQKREEEMTRLKGYRELKAVSPTEKTVYNHHSQDRTWKVG